MLLHDLSFSKWTFHPTSVFIPYPIPLLFSTLRLGTRMNSTSHLLTYVIHLSLNLVQLTELIFGTSTVTYIGMRFIHPGSEECNCSTTGTTNYAQHPIHTLIYRYDRILIATFHQHLLNYGYIPLLDIVMNDEKSSSMDIPDLNLIVTVINTLTDNRDRQNHHEPNETLRDAISFIFFLHRFINTTIV